MLSENFDKVKELWALGMTAGQICAFFNGAFNRNQILGRLYRAGLLGFRAPKTRVQRSRSDALQHRINARRRSPARSLPFKAPLMPLPAGAAGQSFNGDCGPCSITELTLHTCRWPIGDPQDESFGYCGAYTEKGPYCPIHKQIAYVQPIYRIR